MWLSFDAGYRDVGGVAFAEGVHLCFCHLITNTDFVNVITRTTGANEDRGGSGQGLDLVDAVTISTGYFDVHFSYGHIQLCI
jgi:hypothetical protein